MTTGSALLDALLEKQGNVHHVAGHALQGAIRHGAVGMGLGAAAGAISAEKGKKKKGAVKGMLAGLAAGGVGGAALRGGQSALVHSSIGRKMLLHDAEALADLGVRPTSLSSHRLIGNQRDWIRHGATGIGAGLGVGAGISGGRSASHEGSEKKSSALLDSLLEKMAYTGYSETIRSEKPTYELDDETLKRRKNYERGETGLRTGVGAIGGGLTGAVLGSAAGPVGTLVGGALGTAAGGGLGLASSKLREWEASRELARRGKQASAPFAESLAYSAAVFDAVVSGQLGDSAKFALAGVYAALPSHAKVAAEDKDDPSASESDTEARKRRLAELLKKRESTGTATGSASPNPPKGD